MARRSWSSIGGGGRISMLFTTDATPSMLFTADSASDFKLGRVTWPYKVTLSPSTLYARLSKTEYHGSMTSWCRTSCESFWRYFGSLRCFFSSCGRAAKGFDKDSVGMASNAIMNRARSSFLMISSWRDVFSFSHQLDSRCKPDSCLLPCRGEVLAYFR